MNTRDFAGLLAGLFSELVEGPPNSGAYILNPGDPGLLGSLDKLAPQAASASSRGAYHLGAIRQVDSAMRGPRAPG